MNFEYELHTLAKYLGAMDTYLPKSVDVAAFERRIYLADNAHTSRKRNGTGKKPIEMNPKRLFPHPTPKLANSSSPDSGRKQPPKDRKRVFAVSALAAYMVKVSTKYRTIDIKMMVFAVPVKHMRIIGTIQWTLYSAVQPQMKRPIGSRIAPTGMILIWSSGSDTLLFFYICALPSVDPNFTRLTTLRPMTDPITTLMNASPVMSVEKPYVSVKTSMIDVNMRYK